MSDATRGRRLMDLDGTNLVDGESLSLGRR